jgi:HEAT repeat protein
MTIRKSVRRLCVLLPLPIALGCGRDEGAWQTRLKDPNPSVRRAAVHDVASTFDSTEAVPVLTAALRDNDEKVQVAAALALLEIEPRNADCQPIIERALLGGHGPAFIAVGASGEDAQWAVPTLVKLLSDRKTMVRALAAKTLGEIGSKGEEVDAALRRGLRDENRAVRNASQQALDRLRVGADSRTSSR